LYGQKYIAIYFWRNIFFGTFGRVPAITSQDPSPRMALVDFFFGKVKTLLYANPTWGTLGGRDMNIIK
jgi:hypothetical protein